MTISINKILYMGTAVKLPINAALLKEKRVYRIEQDIVQSCLQRNSFKLMDSRKVLIMFCNETKLSGKQLLEHYLQSAVLLQLLLYIPCPSHTFCCEVTLRIGMLVILESTIWRCQKIKTLQEQPQVKHLRQQL